MRRYRALRISSSECEVQRSAPCPTALRLLQRQLSKKYNRKPFRGGCRCRARCAPRGLPRLRVRPLGSRIHPRPSARDPPSARGGARSILVGSRDKENRKARAFDEGGKVPVSLAMTVNGKPVSADVDPRTLLVDFLRNQLALTGTHVGCDTAQCGACTVHLDGQAVKSCNVLAAQAQGANVTDDRRADRRGRHDAPDAGGVPRLPRPAMRLLHAGHGDERDRPRESPSAGATRRRSATSSKATSAAAPAITTSSRPSARAPP